MRIIHCADLHLDSAMESNLPKDKAKQRKQEIIDTYLRMVNYAAANNVKAVIIAGDLFDRKNVRQSVRNQITDSMLKHPDIDFYYLKGNHDTDTLSDNESDISNLKMFSESWHTYSLSDKVKLTGAELNDVNVRTLYEELHPDVNCFNIVVLHGQEDEYDGQIPLKKLRGLGIDYLALGHIHGYRSKKLDTRGTYCYCGCLEGRGFDECGEHGFVLLDIDEDKGAYTAEFVPFASRRIEKLDVDISDCISNSDVCMCIDNAIKAWDEDRNTMVEIILTGYTSIDSDYDLQLVQDRFKDEFFYVKIKDCTNTRIDYKDYIKDMSLKGEFVRNVMAKEDISDNEKALIIKYGIRALMGELV